jgi:hypothetical protein
MNSKNAAKKLEQFLDEELKNKPPIVLLSDGSIAYNNFIIKKNSKEQWNIKRRGGAILDTFNLKVSAIAATKFYGVNNFKNYNELKILDGVYSKNALDADRFKRRYKTTKDFILRDVFVARYVEANEQANYAKQQISSRFKSLF